MDGRGIILDGYAGSFLFCVLGCVIVILDLFFGMSKKDGVASCKKIMGKGTLTCVGSECFFNWFGGKL